MKLKTYRARSMADALTQVKKDLGREAVILHTRMFKHGGFMGFGAKDMVEVTASDRVNVGSPLRAKARPSGETPGAGGAADSGASRERLRPMTSTKPPARVPDFASGPGATIAQSNDERAILSGAAAVDRALRGTTGASERVKITPSPAVSSRVGVVQLSDGSARSTTEVRIYQRPSGGNDGAGSRAGGKADEPMVMPVHNSRAGVRLDADQASGVRAAARLAVEPGSGTAADVKAELAVIRRMVGQVLQTSARATINGACAAPGLKMSDALVKHYSRLIENEVAQEVADEIISAVRDELTRAELGDEAIVRLAVLRRLESLLPVCDDVASPKRGEDGRPLTIALIGPTGVGKTTTIAKLAAAYRLRHGKRVTLITTDTYRIAAVDQLRTYANIIGVPLRVAMTPVEMEQAIQASSPTDVILIDTAGRSPGDAPRLDELRAFLRPARPHQTHLVLSSVASEGSMLRTADRFAELKPNLLLFTKLDEAANLGVMVNVARRVNARLSYVTTGQEVPDDIEPGRADRLARFVLDGKNTPVAGGV